jgi:hypothetical protein
MRARFGVIAVGVAVALCTAAAIVLGLGDDAPKAKTTTAAVEPPGAIDIDPAPVPAAEPASTTATSFLPPIVTIVDDPNAQAVLAPKPRKKAPIVSPVSSNVPTNAPTAAAAPPPNPYAVSKK